MEFEAAAEVTDDGAPAMGSGAADEVDERPGGAAAPDDCVGSGVRGDVPSALAEEAAG